MVQNKRENITDEELNSLTEELLKKSASLSGVHTHQLIHEIKDFNRNISSHFSYAIDFEGTAPSFMDRYTKEGLSKNSKESRPQDQILKHIEQQKRLEKHFNGCNEIHIREKFIYEIRDMLFDGDKIKDQMGFGFGVHTTEAEKLIFAFQAHYFIIALDRESKKNRIVARLILDGILSTIEGYGLWNMSRGLYEHSREYEYYLNKKDDDGNEEGWHTGLLSEENSKRYIKFMLDVAMEQVNYIKEHLAIDKVYKNIQRYLHRSKEGLFDHKPLPEYSVLLFKELLLLGEIRRGDVDAIINKETRTRTTLNQRLEEMGLITSDTPKSRIRIKFNAHFISYIFPGLIK